MKSLQIEMHYQNVSFLITFLLILGLTCYSTALEVTNNKVRHYAKVHLLEVHNKKSSSNLEKKESDDNYKRTLPPNIWTLLAENSMLNNNQTNNPKFNKNEEISNQNEIDRNNLDFNLSIDDDDDDDESIKKPPIKCPKCIKNSVKMSEDDLTNLRIEYIKNQILHKLKMSKRPPKKAIDELPEPIQEGYTINTSDDADYFNRHLDDYFAKTTQKIIFLTQEFDKCKSHENPSVCFTFKISSDLDVSTIESAFLWIYKEPNNSDRGMNHTFLLSEIGFWGKSNKFIKSKTLSISELDQGKNGWEKIDFAWPVKTWIEYQHLEHTIQIACETCSSQLLPISLHQDHKPFIVINTYPQRNLNRQRRNINCGPTSTECCRDSLYIDFATIGWNDWIIQPKGYNAYFCRGFCNRVASITQSGTHHSTIFNKFIHHTSKISKKKLELVPCCTATRYSSLQIFYLDSNNTATQVTLPNMIVESCGCS